MFYVVRLCLEHFSTDYNESIAPNVYFTTYKKIV